VLTTQSSTKVYKKTGLQTFTIQEMNAVIKGTGFLVVAPDPVTCYENAKYKQIQTFEMDQDSTLVYVDWTTCGRENGFDEVWDMDYFGNKTEIKVNGNLVFDEHIVLENTDRSTIKSRMGSFRVLCIIVLIGPLLRSNVDLIEAIPTIGQNDDEVVTSVGELIDKSGSVIRLLGPNVETVQKVMANTLQYLEKDIGGALYAS